MNNIQNNRMNQIHQESVEDYLEALFVLQKAQKKIKSSDLASFMGFSRASVSHAVLAMERDGLLFMDEKYYLHLTERGHATAEKTYRKHIFFEKNLLIAGVDPVSAKKEGSRMGHSLSDDSFERIATIGMQKEEGLFLRNNNESS